MIETSAPNTTAFPSPWKMSSIPRNSRVCSMNGPTGIPATYTPMRYAPPYPSALKSMVRIGNMMIEASTRGTTRYWMGETAILSMASICSVTRMVPSSVAMALPARPVTMRAVNTGDSSRESAKAVEPPT